MIQDAANWIRSLAYLVLAVTFLELLVPENQMNRLVKVIIGFVISAAMVMPIVNWVRTNRDLPEFQFYHRTENVVPPTTETLSTKSSRQAVSLYRATVGLEVARYLNELGIPAQVQVDWTPELGVTQVIAHLQAIPEDGDQQKVTKLLAELLSIEQEQVKLEY